MKRIYTYGHEQVQRNITIGDIIENKKNGIKMTQVTAQNKEEAEILSDQNIDMIITGSDAYEDVRSGAPNTFITAALFAGRFITKDDILKGAIEVAMKGADAQLQEKLLGCMSTRAAANIRDEMEALGQVRLPEVQEAQKQIINVARKLSDDGTIVLAGRGGEEMV